MRPNDYIVYSDVMALTDSEYESFLNYIKFIGFRVLLTAHERHELYTKWALKLDDDGDLWWRRMDWLGYNSSRIPLEEVKRMAALGMIE